METPATIYIVLHTFETGCDVPYGAEVFTFSQEKSAYEKACMIIAKQEHYNGVEDKDIKHFCMMYDSEAWHDAYDFWWECFNHHIVSVVVNQSKVL